MQVVKNYGFRLGTKLGIIEEVPNEYRICLHKILQLSGLSLLIYYYINNPQKLMKVSLSKILGHIVVTIAAAVIWDKFINSLENRAANSTAKNNLSTVSSGVNKLSLIDVVLTAGEDVIFLPAFIYPSIPVKLTIAIIFAGMHYSPYYPFTVCLGKVLGTFLCLLFHPDLINNTIGHILLNYLIIQAIKNKK